MSWVDTHSLSFAARHESSEAEAAVAVLDRLETFRDRLAGRFERTPFEVSVVLHPRPMMLALAHPWLPLARRVAAPASRRYFAGWFTNHEIHVLTPAALERRASAVAGSRDALLLAPEHEYAHLVVGANNRDLPPPFGLGAFRRYLRWAWVCEGAAVHFAGQAPHLRAAIARRLREGARPIFPPPARDAFLLGGSIYSLLERDAGPDAAAALAMSRLSGDNRAVIESAFERPFQDVERAWRAELDSLTSA